MLSITFVVALLDQQCKGVAHNRPKLHPLIKSTPKDASDHWKRDLEVGGVKTEPRQQGPNLEKEKKQTKLITTDSTVGIYNVYQI